MSDEEDDYMSDKILSNCVSSSSKPAGLITVRAKKREHELYKKRLDMKLKKPKSTRELEEESRNSGLDTSIPTNNKGFALLAKMGYVPGQGIGKQEKGISEPIKITLKLDRFGLGRETILKEIKEYRCKKQYEKFEKSKEFNVESYRKRIADKVNEKNTKYDLFKSQKVCENLDLKKDIKEPGEVWFWPEKPKSSDSEDDEEEEKEEILDDLEPSEKLVFLTDYLRTCHLYCIWCGTEFEDAEDMSANCPGSKRDLH